MKIGDEVYIHGYVDEIRQNVVIIRNDGGYFGTVAEEITNKSENPNTCGDAISRQAVMDKMKERDEEVSCLTARDVRDLPSVTPQQRTGRWINAKVGKLFPSNDFKCSECGNILDFNGINCGRGDANYCPNCGAKMEVEE